MDFALTESEQAVRDLAAEILTDHCTPELLYAADRSSQPGFDRGLWAKLAEAGLLGVCIPEQHGGLGLGFVEVALVLEEVGRRTAPVPALAGLALGAAVLARHASPEQQAAQLPAIASGARLVTSALVEPLGDPLAPTTTARRDGDGWVLDGLKTLVPAGTYADAFLVSASTPDGAGLFLVPRDVAGLGVAEQRTISYVPEAQLELSDVRLSADALIGPADGAAVADAVALGTAGAAAVAVGVAESAIKLTAEYTKTREQFGHAIALFQAVGQRAADGYIDTTAMRLTTTQAVWLLAQRRPCAKELAVAKYFASEGGQRIVRGAAHLHGGMGQSREYPMHRYYIWAKQLELTLGSGTPQLVALGRLLAEEPVTL